MDDAWADALQRTAARPGEQLPLALPDRQEPGAKARRLSAEGHKDRKDGAPQGGRGGGKRRGRRGRGGADKVWTSKDKGTRELLALLVKQVLAHGHKIRLLQASSWDAYLLDASHAVITTHMQAMDSYRAVVDSTREMEDAQRRLQELGPPTACLALALVESVHAMDDIGGKVRNELGLYLKKLEPQSGSSEGMSLDPLITKEKLENEIDFIRIERCKDPTKTKLFVAGQDWAARLLVRTALINSGTAQVLKGIAPPGYMENELASWLEALM